MIHAFICWNWKSSDKRYSYDSLQASTSHVYFQTLFRGNCQILNWYSIFSIHFFMRIVTKDCRTDTKSLGCEYLLLIYPFASKILPPQWNETCFENESVLLTFKRNELSLKWIWFKINKGGKKCFHSDWLRCSSSGIINIIYSSCVIGR